MSDKCFHMSYLMSCNIIHFLELSKYIVNRNNLTDYLVSFNETAANLSSNITGDWMLFSNDDIFLTDLNATLVGGVLTVSFDDLNMYSSF